MWRQSFRWDEVATTRRPQYTARGRELNATRRRQRPGVEALEARWLLTHINEFPVPSGLSPSSITSGPDGNLWFTEKPSGPSGLPPGSPGQVGMINPATRAIAEFPDPSSGGPPSITAGADGNLWFTDYYNGGGSLGDIVFVPAITGVVSVTHSKKEITAIILGVDEPLNSASASNRGFYSIDSGIKKRHTLVFSKPARIRTVLYDSTTDTVTLKLAQPFRGPLQVAVHAGVMATDGSSTRGSFTGIVS
jgi:hypothetical protein